MDCLAQLESDINNCSFPSINDLSLYLSANEDMFEDTDLPAINTSLDVSLEPETLNIGNSVSNSVENRRAVEGFNSASSSSSVELSSAAISKTKSLEMSRLNSQLVPWNAIRRNTSVKRHTLSRPTLRHVSSIPTMNNKVSINFNLLIPAESIELPKVGNVILKKPSTTRSSKKLKNLPIMNICDLCKQTFDLRASLMAHKQKHNDCQLVCKYCNYKFKKSVAYSTHLKENCLKIPSVDRRKLLIQEYNKLLH